MLDFIKFWAKDSGDGLITSRLYDDSSFYKAFLHDLKNAESEILIESPFITTLRLVPMLPVLRKARKRGVRIIINTRDPLEHGPPYDGYAIDAVAELYAITATVLHTGKHHRKLAIIDRKILWEGSLNILSQYESCEIMRRIESPVLAMEMIKFIKLRKYLGKKYGKF
jgi:phosphatidylserine/phosphatidylglycerophosphate/cardiolipin synthase-like enzyme